MASTQAMKMLGINDTVRGPLDLMGILETGFAAKSIGTIAGKMAVPTKDMARLLSVSPKTIERYKVAGSKKLSPAISERLLKLAEVRARSEEVFGDPADATEWLKTESMALGGKTPLQMMAFEFGIDLVLKELGRIEHGIGS